MLHYDHFPLYIKKPLIKTIYKSKQSIHWTIQKTASLYFNTT